MPEAVAASTPASAAPPAVAAPPKVEPKAEEAKSPGIPDGSKADAKPETPKPALDPALTSRLAAIERKQAQLNQTRAQVEAKTAELKALETAHEKFQADPIGFLRERGVDVDGVLADFLGRQVPKAPEEELELLRQEKAQRDAEAAKAKAEAEKRRQEEQAREAQSKAQAQALETTKGVIASLEGEAGDILQGLAKEGAKLTGVNRLGEEVSLSPETYVLQAATEEWQAAGSPKISEAQLKKLLRHVAVKLNAALVDADDGSGVKLGAKYRKAPEPARVDTVPKHISEMGGGERAPLASPKNRAEAEKLFRKFGKGR